MQNFLTVADPRSPRMGCINLVLPPATKLGQGYIFTGVCDSVHGGVVSQHALQQGVPGPGGGSAPEGGDAWWRPPPPDGHCCGQNSSYWNAFLFGNFFANNCMEMEKKLTEVEAGGVR